MTKVVGVSAATPARMRAKHLRHIHENNYALLMSKVTNARSMSSVIFVMKTKTRTRIIGFRLQKTRTGIIVIQKY